jgi:hypothetical protein
VLQTRAVRYRDAGSGRAGDALVLPNMSDALVEHLRDLLEPLGRVSARAMFGGHGLYLDGLMIGVILDEALYLKTDAQTRDAFEAAVADSRAYSDSRGSASSQSTNVRAAGLSRLCDGWTT